MTGNYLSTGGRTLEIDLEMIGRLEYSVREKEMWVRNQAAAGAS